MVSLPLLDENARLDGGAGAAMVIAEDFEC